MATLTATINDREVLIETSKEEVVIYIDGTVYKRIAIPGEKSGRNLVQSVPDGAEEQKAG